MDEPAVAFAPVPRGHAADVIFNQLAWAIFRGRIAVGAALPPERLLAGQFGVSRIIARQAVHRLAEIGLVRVRQGGATCVLDPDESADLRTLELRYRLGPQSLSDVLDFTERQLLQGHVLLQIAARRGQPRALERVAQIVEEYGSRGATAEELPLFEERFWGAVAKAGGNRLCLLEVRWWFRLLGEQPRSQHPVLATPEVRLAAMREVARRLIRGEDAAGFYLTLVDRILGAIERQAAKTKRTTRLRRSKK